MSEGRPKGKLGTHSRGKVHETDEGDLEIAIAHNNSEVYINFGSKVAWIAFEPDVAEQFANTILSHAAAIRSGQS